MIKKKISEILHGKIEICKFRDIQNKDNKIYKIDLESKNSKSPNLYCLKDVRIVLTGNTCFSVLKGNQLIEELCFQSKNLVRKNISLNKVLKNGYITFFPKKIKGTSFCLLQDISQKSNYWHFLYDSIAKLHLLDSLNEINFDRVLIPSTKQKFHMQIFQALRLENKIVDCDGLKVIDLEKLIIADHPYWKEEHSWFSDIENLPFWSVEFLRKKFLNITNKKKFRNKIFIDRSDSTSPYNQIHNNAEVKDFLQKKGFEILKFSNLNFEDQISAFKNANVIIGAHGSAFANAAFCRSKTKLVELRQDDHKVSLNSIYKANNLNYKVWLIETNNEGKIFVDIKKLEKYL